MHSTLFGAGSPQQFSCMPPACRPHADVSNADAILALANVQNKWKYKPD